MDAELVLMMLLKESIRGEWVCLSYNRPEIVLSKLALKKLIVVRGKVIGKCYDDFYVKEVHCSSIKELVAIKLELDWIKAINTNNHYCS